MENFRHSKALGQNFLTDKNLLKAIVADACVDNDVVVEVGAGMGALTSELVLRASHVFSYEVDARLIQPLDARFAGVSNLTLCFKDILTLPPELVRSQLGTGYKVVANLPYYITTPLIFYFVEKVGGAESFTIMVQKEVADRLVASPSSKDYGAVTVTLGLEFDIKRTRNVSRKMFHPIPNVDSAVVHLSRRGEISPNLRAFVRQCFSMRRKTLVNNLASFGKERVGACLQSMGLSEAVRGEVLSIEQFSCLYGLLAERE